MPFCSAKLPMTLGGNNMTLNILLLQILSKGITVCLGCAIKHHGFWWSSPGHPCRLPALNQGFRCFGRGGNSHVKVRGCVNEVVEPSVLSLAPSVTSLVWDGTLVGGVTSTLALGYAKIVMAILAGVPGRVCFRCDKTDQCSHFRSEKNWRLPKVQRCVFCWASVGAVLSLSTPLLYIHRWLGSTCRETLELWHQKWVHGRECVFRLEVPGFHTASTRAAKASSVSTSPSGSYS